MNIHKKNFYWFYQKVYNLHRVSVVSEAGGFKIIYSRLGNGYFSVRYSFLLGRFHKRAVFYIRPTTEMV